MKILVAKIHRLCTDYEAYLKNYGNECAYTDRIVEEIISTADELKKKYDKTVPPIKKD